MKNNIRLLAVLGCFVLFAGCATSKTFRLEGEAPVGKTSFELVDKRDEAQKKAEVMSTLVTSCWYGIYRLGDDQLVPSRLAVLSKALEDKLGSKLAGKQVVVNRFEIFNNMQSAFRGSLAQAYGAVGTAIAAGGCQDAFSLERNPNNYPAAIVNVDVSVDGKNFTQKMVQIEPQGHESTIDGPLPAERIRRAVSIAIDNIIAMASK